MAVMDELMSVLVAQICGNDVEVSKNATETVWSCCRRLSTTPLSEKVIGAITASWKQCWDRVARDRQQATTDCVRCATAIVEISSLQEANMEYAISNGATAMLLDMLADVSDPLLQMSTLDLLETLALTQPMHSSRARWLFSHPVLRPLLDMSGGSEAVDSPDPILGGPSLRLLSALCHLGQKDASLFRMGGTELLSGFHRALLQFDDGGELDRLALIDAISSFASASPESLEVVLNDPTIRDKWLSLSVAQPKLKSAILHSVAMVMDPPTACQAGGDLSVHFPSSAALMRLYSCLGQTNDRDATELVIALARSPLVETRLGAYATMAAFAKRGPGAQILMSHGGFYEFLINRKAEDTKDGKEAKFAIVESILQCDARGLLADNIVQALEKYQQQGPFYVQAQRYNVMAE